jgi:diadenosine tetraphosphate (Ap4A) HIT family hydrolase
LSVDNCLICNRINMIKEETNPYLVAELETGYVVVGDHQLFKGYTLFLCKHHKTELHFLADDFKSKFLVEMSKVAEAV